MRLLLYGILHTILCVESATIHGSEPSSVGMGGGAVLVVHGRDLLTPSSSLRGTQLPVILVGGTVCPLLLDRSDFLRGTNLACRLPDAAVETTNKITIHNLSDHGQLPLTCPTCTVT